MRVRRLSQVRGEGRPAWRECREQGPGRDCARWEKEAQVRSGREGRLCRGFVKASEEGPDLVYI